RSSPARSSYSSRGPAFTSPRWLRSRWNMTKKKRLVLTLVALGWIPTLAILFGARWIAGQPLAAASRSPMKITRLYTGADGTTKVEEFEVPLKPQGRGTELSEI